MIYERRLKEQKEEMFLCYGGWDQDLKPGQRYGPVIRDTYIIECCTGGKGSVIINGTEYPVKGGDCYFLLPGDTVIHTADTVTPRTGVFCSVSGLRVGNYLRAAGISSDHPFAPQNVFDEILEFVEKLVRTKSDSDYGAPLRQAAYLYSIFGALLRCSGRQVLQKGTVDKAIHQMETCYPEPLSVSALAAEVGLERCYFSVLFKKETGLSPYQYLSRLRIRKAGVLLDQGECSIAEAAEAVGIPPNNFSRLFKKWMMTTPSQYVRSRKQ